MNKKVLTFVLVAMLGLAFSGCGKKVEEKAIEKYLEQAQGVKDVDLSADNQGITITDDQGNVISSQVDGSLPPNWPSEVPYYQAGEIETAASLPMPNGNMLSISILTNDDEQKIADYYRAELKQKGWTITSESTMAGTYLLTAEKDKMSTRMTINKEQAKSGLTIIQTLGIEN